MAEHKDRHGSAHGITPGKYSWTGTSDSEDSEMFLHDDSDDQRPMFEHFYETIERNCPVVYEIPGGMLYGTRIDLRVRPSEDMKSFTISLQRDIVGNPKAGVAMKVHYDIEKEEEISCLALVGDDIIETPVAPVKREMFEDRFFVLSISTMPLHYKVYVDSIFLAEQQHYMDVQSVLYIRIDGDLLVYCAEVTDNFSSQHLLPVGRRDVEATPVKPLRRVPASSPRSKAKKDATMDTLPKEYQTMLYELEEQSSRIDEEIKRISQKTVQKNPGKKSKRKVPAPNIDELSDEETPRRDMTKRKKGQGPGLAQEKDKTRFGKFFQKLKKPRKSFRKDKGQLGKSQATPTDSDNASELSTDFEAYLMMTDSDVDSRESPTELLYEVEEQERKRRERLKEVEDGEVTATAVTGAESARNGDGNNYDSAASYSDGGLGYDADMNESIEISLSTMKEPEDQIIRIKTPADMPDKTRLRISTQIVNEDGEVLSESIEEMTPRGTFTGVHLDSCMVGHPESQKCDCPCHEKKYHLIHHHVHHHVGQDEKKVKLEGGIEVPPYSSDAPPSYTPVATGGQPQENTGLLRRRDPIKERWRWLCCQCYSY